MNTQEISTVACPNCGARFTAPVEALINVGADPAQKTAFLQGQLNVSQCPQCGYHGEMNTPVLYFDPEKELALVSVPTSLNFGHADEQKIIGDLTNRLMNALPAAERKAYLFNPKTFLNLDSLRKAILEADGITEEMIQSQSAKVALLDKMLKASSEAALRKLVEENDDQLDRQFFEIITATALQALNGGNPQQGQQLLGFRQFVAQLSSQGEALIADIDAEVGLQMMTPERFLENLRQAKNDQELINLIRSGRQLLDYAFFQNLTNQIDALSAAGDQAEAEALKSLRSRILDLTARIEDEDRKTATQAAQVIGELLQADDPKAAIRERLPDLNQAFFAILAAQIQEAQQKGQQQVAQRLQTLYAQIMEIVQERLPPELKLLNELLEGGPEGVKETLRAKKDQVTPQFMTLLDQAEQEFAANNQTELVEMIGQIRKEAEAQKQGGGVILLP